MSQHLYSKFDRPLQLELRPSSILLSILIATHLTAGLGAVLIPVADFLKAFVFIVLTINAFYLHRHFIQMRFPHSLRSIDWNLNSGWSFSLSNGEVQSTNLCQPLFISSTILAISFSSGNYRKHAVILAPDSLSRDEHRRLRVRLLASVQKKEAGRHG